MKIGEIKSLIDEKQKSSNMLHKQLINLQTELTQLRSQYNLIINLVFFVKILNIIIHFNLVKR